ncbi:MAG: hypothetical protein NT106_00600 [Candidatus Sumerlaeota bacterium]|nr:hypothetical protein [Candidatus Sumerlaeota bacterium]
MRIYVTCILIIIFCLTSPFIFSDSMEMAGGKSFPEVCVDSFSGGSPTGEFSIRLVTGGKIAEQSFPVSEDNVISIEFKALAPAAAPSSGRTASLLMGHGGKYDGVAVVKYENKDGAGVFTIRTAGAPPDSTGYPVMSYKISKLQFTEVSAAATPAVTPAGTSGVSPPSVPTQSVAPPPPEDALLPGFKPTPAVPIQPGTPAHTATPTPAMGESRPGAPPAFLSTGNNASSQTEPAETRRSSPNVESRDTTGRQAVDENRFFGLAKMMSTKSGRILLNIITWSILAIINGFIVFLSVRAAGEPISFPKAILIGFLISIVGGLVWKLCMLIPICLVNLFIAIVVWFFTARAIIMGMVEVLEEKATAIVITIIVLNIALRIGLVLLIFGTMVAALTM